MAITTPPDLARGKVSWTVGRTDGATLPGARGTVRFEATAVAVAYSTATVIPSPVETPVVDGIMTPVDLLVNDPEVWNWRVTPRVGVPWESFPIDVTGPVDLATAAQTPGKDPVRAVKGETGPGLTGAVRYQDGKVEFEIKDGTWTAPVTMPPGPPGPGNTLRIGTVSTSAAGDNAEASISGESPTQYLNLALPRGDKPALPYQPGRRAVTGLITGSFTLERMGTTVSLSCSNGRPPTTGTVAALNLPAGFRPAVRATGVASEGSAARPVVAQSYSPYVVEIRGVAAANSYVDFTIRFETADPIPTTPLPGTPA